MKLVLETKPITDVGDVMEDCCICRR